MDPPPKVGVAVTVREGHRCCRPGGGGPPWPRVGVRQQESKVKGSQAFPLRAIPELPLLLVREEGDVIVLLRMALRIISLLARVAATPLLAGNNEWLVDMSCVPLNKMITSIHRAC
ncbi:unnamed protein product [Miscanthus lutarioriparius]|uniref:Uncharacterized protein n=1 Tax=Miscanthus lutarioriparius TaxID=422564 RepID=A0A811RFD5_9POAL|nr:unnamed protein product [Miscanthus lutarioriparius]